MKLPMICPTDRTGRHVDRDLGDPVAANGGMNCVWSIALLLEKSISRYGDTGRRHIHSHEGSGRPFARQAGVGQSRASAAHVARITLEAVFGWDK
ncbi:MAG: hypothetical protein NVSMB6_10150 [Burkholderiaceae bacterium]